MPSLNWIGKDEVINYNPPYHTLEKKYTFNAKNSDNMIIKGDNLLALKSLLPKYIFSLACDKADCSLSPHLFLSNLKMAYYSFSYLCSVPSRSGTKTHSSRVLQMI